MMPKIPLTDAQRGFVEDDAQFRFWAASRQTGKSHGLAADSILACVEKRTTEVLLSAGERQSKELMAKVAQQSQALGMASEVTEGFFEQTEMLQLTARYPNGSRIIGLPSNPKTARGYTANVKLDEFGLHENPREIWTALAPSATRGFRVAMASTFMGTGNKFYEIGKMLGLHTGLAPEMQPVRKGVWSGHWTDIHMAAAQALKTLGLRIDVNALREGLCDEEAWQQEYLNVPMEDGADYIPLKLILACTNSEATLDWDGKVRPGQHAGFDVARKRDGSILFIGEEVGPLLIVRGVKVLSGMTFAQQRGVCEEVAKVIEAGGGRFAVDATGIGMQLAEELREKSTCVEPVQFGSAVDTGVVDKEGKPVRVLVKERLAAVLKQRCEEQMIWLPESPQLQREFQAVKRYVGPTGNVRLDAGRTEGSGHADWFWAAALMCGAAEGAQRYVPLSDGGLVGETVMGGLMEKVF